MKNKKTKIGLLFASSLAFFAIGIATIGTNNSIGVKEVNAASEFTSTSLPSSMTIDLNDSTPQEIESYYSSLTGKGSSQLSGTNLLKNLKGIISNNVSYYSYDTVSNIYAITDRDWTNSPASEIGGGGTYNASSKTITNYSHTSEINNRQSSDLYLHLLYCDYSVKSKTLYKGDGDVSSTSVSFDKEHAWSQSHGFDDGTSSGSNLTGAGSDLHHLKAGTQYGNRTLHSNYSYGFVKENDGDWSSKTYETKNKRGEPLVSHSSDQQTKVFEPQDSDKGDIARALLYMVACYNNYDGSTPTPANPALQLVNYVISGSTTGYSSTNLENGYYGILQDILAWHHIDPVDQYEIHRNNLIYKNYQHNRNPFIDYPEWVDYIWGTAEYNSSSKTISYNSNPTGFVDLSQDVINGYRTKTLTSISVTTLPTKTSYYKNDTLDTTGIVVTGTYDDSSTSDITSGCTFSPTTLSTAGTQQITVTHSSGLTTHFNVTVSNTTRTLSSIAVTTMPTKTTYIQGETLNTTGIVVTGTYSDSSTDEVTSGCTFSPTTLNTVGTQQITVTHTASNKQTSFNVTVEEQQASEATISITKGDYTAGYDGTDGTSGTITKTVGSENDLSISYSGINTQSAGGSSYNYTMYFGGKGYIYSTTAPNGYYVSNVAVTFTSNTGLNGVQITLGSSAITSKQATTSSATKSGTYSVNNTTQTNTFWNFSTSGGNVQVSSISVTYSPIGSSGPTIWLDMDSASVAINDTVTLTATTSGGSGITTWSSSNDSVATVDNGLVYGVTVGSATITATYSGVSAQCVVTVTSSDPSPVISADGLYFRKTSLLSEITNGKYILAANVSGTYYTLDASLAFVSSTNKKFAGSTITVDSNSHISKENSSGHILEISRSDNIVSIKGTEKYIGWGSSTNFEISTTVASNNYQWTIALANTNGTFSLTNVKDTTRKIEYRHSSSYDYFGPFSAATDGTEYFNIELFKEEQATAYAATFMDAFTCDNGAHEPSFKTGYSWSSLGTTFSNLDQADREVLTGATANEIGTTVEQAVARYDKVVSHWKYENFMSRSITGLNNRASFISNDNELFIVIISTSSIVSVTAIGLYMLLKKRKEQ